MPKIETARARMLEEKRWIRENQGTTGEIYLNLGNSDRPAGDVNPYFSCFAAQGLLAGTPTQEDMDSVKNYLLWHAQAFLQAQGVLENHRITDGVLQPTGKYDSVDSYVAVFVSLLCQYGELGGDVATIDPDKTALELAMQQLSTLTENGLTRVKPGKSVFYTMDNLEVLAAYRDLARFCTSPQGISFLGGQSCGLSDAATNAAQQCEAGIVQKLWNPQENQFWVGLGKNDAPLGSSGMNVLYPDAVAQIYSAAFHLPLPGVDINALYRRFCDTMRWEAMEFGEDEAFSWGVLCYIAAVLGDAERAEAYLTLYAQKTAQSRAYPLHTADAGWVAKACAVLETHYTQKMERTLLQDLLYKQEGTTP